MQTICVFCGSSPGARTEYTRAAQALGREIGRRGLNLVYGGGKVGLMGAVADAALSAGANVTGVIPESLLAKELAHLGLTDLRVTASMHERKAMMADLADAFIAMPGGFGTMDEYCEILTWAQLGMHVKPCGLLNIANYYDPLLTFIDHAVHERFIRPEHRDVILVDSEPADLLDRMEQYHAQQVEKWIDRKDI